MQRERSTPPRPVLEWEEVVEYAFLSEFDILSETHTDVRIKPWANPAARRVMDMYFKIQRAKEELVRLNIELKWLITFMHDEVSYLEAMQAKLLQEQPRLAHVLAARLSRLRLFNQHHDKNLEKLRSLARCDFDPSVLTPGRALDLPQMPDPPMELDIDHPDKTPELRHRLPPVELPVLEEETEEIVEDQVEEQVQEIMEDIDFLAQIVDRL